ncbi:UPF0481 plant-like protein [Quillaja saponaria]|uniref:UPF0481 plant-like protein n=1 Tax=Quillaja saponaria TaxID=32244 RepID=A0AAD7PWJ7_QUISA|nr:UPF0481 plant-like protein [Quillaja saponaria]
MASNSIFHSSSDEKSWVVHITEIFKSLDHEIQSIPVCVFHVPKSLSSAKPEDYVPQLVALGPYRHFRPELYPTERFKLIAAKRVLNLFQNIQLSKLISEIEKLGPYIRAFMPKFKKNGEPMSHLIHTSGVKLSKDAILRDVLMLENQIPLAVLRKIFTIICSKPELVDEAMNSMFMSFCHALTPLPLDQNCSSQVVLNHAHLLDLMYHLILQERYPNRVRKKVMTILINCSSQVVLNHAHLLDLMYHWILQERYPEPCEEKGNDHINNVTRDQPSNTSSPSPFPCRKTITGTLHFFKKKVLDPVLNYVQKLSPQMDGIGFLKPIQGPINLVLQLGNKLPLDSLSNSDSDVAPVVVTIPSMTQLHAIGIKFRPAINGIVIITFDEKTGTFYLPKVTLDVNSEVIMRNLVAYKAMTKTKSESLIFTRYTELMSAIVDTVEDVEVLVEKKIVVSSLDDNEVEKVFNGTSKSIGPTKTPILDEPIAKVNKCYNGTEMVKSYRLMKKCVYSSWRICIPFAMLLLLALIGLQSFCSVYDCPRIFKTDQEAE